MSDSTLWITCGALQTEIEELRRRGQIGGRSLPLDSHLHMNPDQLEITLTATLAETASPCPVVIVYGDCCPGMRQLVERSQVVRIPAINCVQLLLGRSRYRELMREQAFLLLPEWAGRWEEALRVRLGLSRQIAPEFMRSCHRSLVYLDTGLIPIPRTDLDDCAGYVGLPWRVEAVGLDHLLAGLLSAERSARTLSSKESL